MEASIPKWIFASLAKHFSATGLPYHVEGAKRATNDKHDWTEYILDGPDFEEISRGYFRLQMTVNVLVNSIEDNFDAYRYVKNSGLVASYFWKNISVYKYGDTVLDTGEYLGCLKLISPVFINHFGRTNTSSVYKSSVVGNYQMEIKI